MQRPRSNTSIHQKTTRKHQCPSKYHQEATISTQGPPRNASIGPETRKQMHWAHMYVTGTPAIVVVAKGPFRVGSGVVGIGGGGRNLRVPPCFVPCRAVPPWGGGATRPCATERLVHIPLVLMRGLRTDQPLKQFCKKVFNGELRYSLSVGTELNIFLWLPDRTEDRSGLVGKIITFWQRIGSGVFERGGNDGFGGFLRLNSILEKNSKTSFRDRWDRSLQTERTGPLWYTLEHFVTLASQPYLCALVAACTPPHTMHKPHTHTQTLLPMSSWVFQRCMMGGMHH